MAALGALIHGDLPPAGNPLSWVPGAGTLPDFPGYRASAVQCGTAALALALIGARLLRPEVAQPEVVLPGYGCPDLVAAAEYAGLRPRLADIGADDPAFDMPALEESLNANTVAVVAVNFLGIAERLGELRALLAARAIALVEDNAQCYPEATRLEGDMVCLSFGRGKPVSLLGGGLLLWRDGLAGQLGQSWTVRHVAAAAPAAAAQLRAKSAVYNLLLRPHLYLLLNRNPLLALGATRYKALPGIRAIDPLQARLLSANVERHCARTRLNEERARQLLARHPVLIDLPSRAGARSGRLLRYPLLCRDGAQRDRLWQELRREGLGATAMYQHPLPDVEGVAGRVIAGALPNAAAFARRLLTLPLHVGVRESHWQRMDAAMRAVLGG